MTPPTAEWVSKAEGDYVAVSILRRSRKPNRYDTICFHCQQCIEKYLKARLNDALIEFPKTHDLEELLDLVTPVEPLWVGLKPRLKSLSAFAVLVRYPGFFANRKKATKAYEICTHLRALTRTSLGFET